ncbi:MAG: hypothetical protein RLY16_1367 [Bacteroidota bacterium]
MLHPSFHFWQFIARQMQQEIKVALLYVLESKGSSPGRQGFAMAVTATQMMGSLGGGIMEHKLVEMAKDKLAATADFATTLRQIHNKSVATNQSGMICSGEQTIFLTILKEPDLASILNMLVALENNQNGRLIINSAGLQFDNQIPPQNFSLTKSEDFFQLIEKIGYKNQLTIIGGGHCALALSKLMHSMDFYIRVYDNRPNLNTLQANSFAHEQIVVEDYATIEKLIIKTSSHYVVIMTFGYRTDDLVLRSLQNRQDFHFLGVLGSKNKIEKMMNDYAAEGIDPQFLAKIQAPIGLPIFSQSPEEIAISIAAQIIQIKNQPSF